MNTSALVETLSDNAQDFEWYPTTRRMVEAVIRDMHSNWSDPLERCGSILDIGAGDGRVLMMLSERYPAATLYGIEKSTILQQQQPDKIIPVGTEFIEQDLMSLPVDVTFSNPPYSVFEEWAYRIISTVHTHRLYLILPQRWDSSEMIRGALKTRNATATVIARDDFSNAERAARAVVHIICVTFGESSDYQHYYRSRKQDPFNVWFDENINTFDREDDVKESENESALARIYKLDNIPDMVASFNEDYTRMENNYRAIFKLDASLLKELGVNKESVREGLKKRMQGLKHSYWQGLFAKLDVITSRLTTKTKKVFLERLTGQTAIAFTISNAYAVVLWAIKAANQYFDIQIVDVFRMLSTHDGVENYKSNHRTWEKDGWRYNNETHDHYRLDYRIVLDHYRGIFKADTFGAYEYPGNLHTSCHEIIADVIAVFSNLGFMVHDTSSLTRQWHSNSWQDFHNHTGEVVFQVKAFLNGNLHFRFDQQAIKALNIEAGRLLGWLRSPQDVVEELGYSVEDAAQFFGSQRHLGASTVKLLTAVAA